MTSAVCLEPRGRIVKALHFADLLDAAGIGSTDAATMAACEWRMVAQAARARRVPSERTRALVTTLLQRREAARAIFARTAPISE